MFLGLTCHFRMFMKGYSTLVVPLTLSTRKMQQWKWTAECSNAFYVVKKMLVNASVLVPEYQNPFVVISDASNYGIGVVLL